MIQEYRSTSEAETERIARALAGQLGPGPAIILLYGDLGAGKTAFVRGVVAGAGGAPTDVTSPTFVLMQEYAGVRTVHHVDLYRLTPRDAVDLEPQLLEMMSGSAIVAVEWADRLGEPRPDAIQVRLEDAGADDRVITIEFPEPMSGPEPGS